MTRSSRAATAVALALALCTPPPAVWAQQKPSFMTSIPTDDKDLEAIAALALKLKARADECKVCKGDGGEVVCSDSVASANQIDNLRVALHMMAAPLHEAAVEAADLNRFVSQHHALLNDMNNFRKQGLAISKALSDSGKALLELASIIDAYKTLGEVLNAKPPQANLPDRFKYQHPVTDANGNPVGNVTVTTYHGPSPDDSLATALKEIQRVQKAATGSIDAFNNVQGAARDSMGWAPPGGAKATLPQTLATLVDIKSKMEDADKYLRPLYDMAKEYKAGTLSADEYLPKAKTMGSFIAKQLLPYAEKARQQLQNEIAQDEQILAAEDQSMQGTLDYINRIHRREQALQAAIDAIGEAARTANSCAIQCANAPWPKEVPAGTGTYGAQLLAANHAAQAASNALTGKMDTKLCTPKKAEPAHTPAAQNPPDCKTTGGLKGPLEKEVCQFGGGR